MINDTIHAAFRRAGIFVGWLLIALCAFITVSALARKLMSVSLQGVDEYGGYLLAITSTLGFSYALLERAHIRIDLMRNAFGKPGRAVMDLLALAALSFFACSIAYAAFGVAKTSLQMNAQASTALKTPLILPQGLWAAGLGLFALLTLWQLAREIPSILVRNWEAISRNIGTKELTEEITEELDAYRQRRLLEHEPT